MKPVYKLSWIYNSIMSDVMHRNHDNNIWSNISRNCPEPHLLQQYEDKINWTSLSTNEHIMTFIEFDFLKNNNDKLDKTELSRNVNAVPLLEMHPGKINYNELCGNKKAIHLIKCKIHDYKVYESICWDKLSSNSSDDALDILEQHFYRINWKRLSRNKNPRAIHLLRENPSKIDWYELSGNSNPDAIKIIKEFDPNMDHVNWVWMSLNKNGIRLLEKHIDKIYWNYLSISNQDENILFLKNYYNKINWEYLSRNPNKEAIKILEENLHKVNWYWISGNQNAYHILKKNLNKVNMSKFMCNFGCLDIIKELIKQHERNMNDNDNDKDQNQHADNNKVNICNYKIKNTNKIIESFNPIINNLKSYELLFELDYDKMRENNSEFLQELQEYVFDPERFKRLSIMYKIEFIDIIRAY